MIQAEVEKWPNSCWLIAKLFVQARLLASAAERDTELESRTQVPRLLQPATWISVEEETHLPKQLGNMEEFPDLPVCWFLAAFWRDFLAKNRISPSTSHLHVSGRWTSWHRCMHLLSQNGRLGCPRKLVKGCKRLVSGLWPQYTPFTSRLCSYNPFTNQLLTSTDIRSMHSDCLLLFFPPDPSSCWNWRGSRRSVTESVWFGDQRIAWAFTLFNQHKVVLQFFSFSINKAATNIHKTKTLHASPVFLSGSLF